MYKLQLSQKSTGNHFFNVEYRMMNFYKIQSDTFIVLTVKWYLGHCNLTTAQFCPVSESNFTTEQQ